MQKIEFKNLPDETTPINASNLNQIQDNVEQYIDLINSNISKKMNGQESMGSIVVEDITTNIKDLTNKFTINSENAEFSNTYASKIFKNGNTVNINLFLTLKNPTTSSFENLNLGKLDGTIIPKTAVIDNCLVGTHTYSGWTFDVTPGQVNVNSQGDIVVRSLAPTSSPKEYIGINIMYFI